MKRYIRIYFTFFKYSLIRAMIYKENFIIWSLVTFGWFVLNLLFYQIVYLNVEEIEGWTKAHVILLLGFTFIFDFLMWGLLWQNMQRIPKKINQGTLDLELTKPINKQFLISFQRLGNDDINSLFLGIGTIIYALKMGNIFPSLADILFSIIAVAIAFIFIYSAWFTSMCVAFWFERIDNLHFLFPGLRQFWRVPQPFYKGVLRGILTFVIPVTLITTVPTQILLKKPSLVFFLVLAFFAFISLKFSNWFFKIALKRYSGASS